MKRLSKNLKIQQNCRISILDDAIKKSELVFLDSIKQTGKQIDTETAFEAAIRKYNENQIK